MVYHEAFPSKSGSRFQSRMSDVSLRLANVLIGVYFTKRRRLLH